jgi:hypothetical protein
VGYGYLRASVGRACIDNFFVARNQLVGKAAFCSAEQQIIAHY